MTRLCLLTTLSLWQTYPIQIATPDPEPSRRLQTLADLSEAVSGIPARDFDGFLDCPMTPLSTPADSQRAIKIEIDAAMARQRLDPYDVFEKVQAVLLQIPGVYQEDYDAFDFPTCAKWIEEGLPVNDSIWISAFQSALQVRLVDL